MSEKTTNTTQNADIFPATTPERIFSDAPPCLEQLVTSLTCFELVLVNTFVNSGINAPAIVPQEIIADKTHHKAGCSWPLASLKSPNSTLLAINVMTMDTAEVIHTR